MKTIISNEKYQYGIICKTPEKPFMKDGRIIGTSKPTNDTGLEEENAKNDELLCRQCVSAITNEVSRIAINGGHSHTFANPHGIVFEIGCFKRAAGCGLVGQPSKDFSWFPPDSWQVAICGSCLTHVGWYYSSPDHGFFGLILDRLINSGR